MHPTTKQSIDIPISVYSHSLEKSKFLYYNKFTLFTNISNKKLNKPLFTQTEKNSNKTQKKARTLYRSKGPAMKQMYNFRSNEKSFLTTRDVKSNKVKST